MTKRQLLAMTVEEHVELAAELGTLDGAGNVQDFQLRQLAVQSHLLWAIVKRGQKRDQR